MLTQMHSARLIHRRSAHHHLHSTPSQRGKSQVRGRHQSRRLSPFSDLRVAKPAVPSRAGEGSVRQRKAITHHAPSARWGAGLDAFIAQVPSDSICHAVKAIPPVSGPITGPA